MGTEESLHSHKNGAIDRVWNVFFPFLKLFTQRLVAGDA
jgi:hypothetical protein